MGGGAMTHCAGCGAERDPGTRFCRRCGRPFEEDGAPPRSGVGEQRASGAGGGGHGPAWYAGLAGGVAVLVVAVVVGGMALAGTGDGEPPEGGTAYSTPWAAPESTPMSPRPLPLPTSRPTIPRPTPPPTPTPVGNDVVEVSASAAQHRFAPAVVDVVTTYVVSINDRDFATWVSLFTPAMQAEFDLDQLAAGFRSTHDSEVRLVSIEDLADGRVAAAVEFVSTQDAVDGPDGLTCTRWGIVLFLQVDQGRLAIGRPPPEYQASYQAC